ncbi:MAG: hypothetical protein U5J95_05420 [Balneolaceae bacterium]|nr:hypothetical protein [Balneolaceae bacterium]
MKRIRDEVFPFIKELGGKNGSTYRKHMEGAMFLFPKAFYPGAGGGTDGSAGA